MCVSKVGQDGNNGTNARIFIPIETMRNLFRLKEQNSEDAISFLELSSAYAGRKSRRQKVKSTKSSRAATASIPNWKTSSRTGTPSKTTSASARSSTHGLFPGRSRRGHAGLGAIGIINIMLVSVTERTREIGLRKALGATHRAILTQFFVEGAFLTALSGGIGLAITTALVALSSRLAGARRIRYARASFPHRPSIAILSLAVAGIAAGLYPARQAALLEPVEALRQE